MPYKDKEQQREFQRKWIAKKRAKYFEGKSCVNCGSKNNLELDHIDPYEKVSHRIWSWKEERFLEEVKKCQILCNPCHMEKSLKDMERMGFKKKVKINSNF